MKGNRSILLPIMGIGALAVGGWNYVQQPPPAHLLIGVDPSLSVAPNCAGLRASVESVVLRSTIRPGSTLTMLAMGETRAAPEPEMVLRMAIPVPSDDVQGRRLKEQRYREELEGLMSEVEAQCAAIATTKHTPLYRLLEQGLAQLRQGGQSCPVEGACRLLIKTDLIEDVSPEVTQLLRQAAKDPQTAVPPTLVGSLDNRGIDIEFCGTAEVRPVPKQGIAPPSAAALKRVWRALFLQPGRVSFAPFCTASNDG